MTDLNLTSDLTTVLPQSKALDLTIILSEDIWTDLLSNLNLFTQTQPIFESTDYLQQIVLNNVQHNRYKHPVKKAYVSDDRPIEVWKLDGLKHRDQFGPNAGPAYTEWRTDGTKLAEDWYQNGQKHRDQVGPNAGPAVTEWHRNGNKRQEEWWQNGQKHRDDGPAYIEWRQNGVKYFEKWYRNGQRHRDDNPAVTYWRDGTKMSEEWYRNDQLHRYDGPAYTEWHQDGYTKFLEEWYRNGQRVPKPKQ